MPSTILCIQTSNIHTMRIALGARTLAVTWKNDSFYTSNIVNIVFKYSELQNVKFFTQINSFQINLPQEKARKS